MPKDEGPRKRAQTATERDLQSPHLGLKPAPGEVEALADESDSDGTPIAKQGPDQYITPPPADVRSDPTLMKMWGHVDHRYTAAANHVNALASSFLGSTDARDKLDEVEKTANSTAKDLTSLGSKLKIVGTIATLVIGASFALAIKALYGAGLDTGTVNTTLIYLQRQIDDNQKKIDDNNDEIRKALERLDDKLEDSTRNRSRGARLTSPPAPSGANGDAP